MATRGCDEMLFAAFIVPIWVVMMGSNNLFRARAVCRFGEELRRLLVSGLLVSGFLVAVLFLTQSNAAPTRLRGVGLTGDQLGGAGSAVLGSIDETHPPQDVDRRVAAVLECAARRDERRRQVSGRSETDFERYRRFDLFYVDNWSLTHDVKIVAKTFLVVLLRRGSQ